MYELDEEVEQILNELRAQLNELVEYSDDQEAVRDLINRKLLEFELELSN